jgi:multidrug efflux system membrane fusion protein
VRTQINGQLQDVAFQEGQIVQKGDYLAQIDPRPYQTTLEQAEGNLVRDQALLKEAQLNADRYRKLVAQDSISKQTLDTQESLVQQYVGAIATDQGLIDSSKLNLVYCHITAPVTGRVGLRQVDAGNYVQTSDANGLVTLTQLQPITVLFTLPEDDLPAIMKRLADGAELPVTAYDRTQTTKLAVGKLISVDNQIDVTTGTIKMRAQFDNQDNILFPNQFVNVELLVDTLKDTVIVPSAAIQRGAPGTYVYLVKPAGTADSSTDKGAAKTDDAKKDSSDSASGAATETHKHHKTDGNATDAASDSKDGSKGTGGATVTVQPVKLGPVQGDNVAITDGLKEGDQVATDGTDKLRDGAKISIK